MLKTLLIAASITLFSSANAVPSSIEFFHSLGNIKHFNRQGDLRKALLAVQRLSPEAVQEAEDRGLETLIAWNHGATAESQLGLLLFIAETLRRDPKPLEQLPAWKRSILEELRTSGFPAPLKASLAEELIRRKHLWRNTALAASAVTGSLFATATYFLGIELAGLLALPCLGDVGVLMASVMSAAAPLKPGETEESRQLWTLGILSAFAAVKYAPPLTALIGFFKWRTWSTKQAEIENLPALMKSDGAAQCAITVALHPLLEKDI